MILARMQRSVRVVRPVAVTMITKRIAGIHVCSHRVGQTNLDSREAQMLGTHAVRPVVCAAAGAVLALSAGPSSAQGWPQSPFGRREAVSAGVAAAAKPTDGPAMAQAVTPSVRVNDVTTGGQHLPTLAVSPAGQVNVAWVDCPADQDCTIETPDIYFAKSTDGGLLFSARVLVSDDGAAFANAPRIATGAGAIYVVWHDDRATTPGDASWDVYLSRSTDGGMTFSPSVRVNEHVVNAYQYEPDLAVAPDGSVYVSWQRYAYDSAISQWDSDVYVARSTDGGVTFGPSVKASDGPGNQFKSAIGVGPSGRVYVAWSDFRADSSGDVYLAHSTNGGASFSANIRVNPTAGQAQVYPDLAVDGGERVYVAWLDARRAASAVSDVYMARSTDLGLTFGNELRASDTDLPANAVTDYLYPSITAAGNGRVAVVWYDNHTGDWDTYLTRSFDAGISVVPGWRVNDLVPNSQSVPDIFMTPGFDVHCVYRDRSSGDFEIAYIRDSTGSASGLSFNTLTPCRLLDTRSSHPPSLAASGTRTFTLTGACGVPPDAKALAVNVTATNAGAQGHLRLWPGDASMPVTSTVNFLAGLTRANNAILALAADGSGTVKVFNAAPATVDFVLDVAGYYR